MASLKIDPADVAFSWWVRSRDEWTCKRCWTEYHPPTTALQCSHYFGRRMEGTRFDPENCDALCHGCHRYWEKEDREGYRRFKINQLGEQGYDKLQVRAHAYHKKDRSLALIYWRERLKQDFPMYYRQYLATI